jgi:hypothetical protein
MLLLAVSSILAISCGTTVSKINVEKGTFQAMKPPNIYGSERYFDVAYSQISYDANIGKNKTIPLPEFTNEYVCVTNDICLHETTANINYRLIETVLGFQFHIVLKDNALGTDDSYVGFGGGVQNFPYLSLMYGYNGEFIEIGTVAFWGAVMNRASYEGVAGYYREAYLWHKESKYHEYTKWENRKCFNFYGGLVAHASFYWKKFALNYSASISEPWVLDDLPVIFSDDEHTYDTGYRYADPSFSFPVLLMQDIGISYMPYKIKYRIGVNQITGVKFPGQYWGFSVQMAYGDLVPGK